MKTLSRLNKSRGYFILIILNILISCDGKVETKEEFIKKFQSDLRAGRIEQIANYSSFPLQNGEYLAEQEVDKVFFRENFEVIFDSTALEQIINSRIDEFVQVDNLQFLGYSEGFRINVDYEFEDTETTVFYIFAKVDNEIVFVGVDMAG